MRNENGLIYLAALLHDIGKFYQRADSNGAGTSSELSAEIKALEPHISPKHWETQKYTHKHVLWTAQFYHNQETYFKKNIEFNEGISFDKLLRMSASHHNPAPDSLNELIIQKADHYSSGVDRDKKDGSGWKDAEEEADNRWDAFKRTRMRSIFEDISINKSNKTEFKKKLPLTAISTTEDYFPVDAGINAINEDYKSLWKAFETELNCIENKNVRSFNESLLYLLEKYTSRIPSSTQHLPDVSLYDHLKTTAAFALCLKEYINDRNLNSIPSPDEKPFALVGGTLSGIQKFIYGIISKGAAKNLKGRSFYLQLLVDNIVLDLLETLSLQQGNIVYSSGGGFYIIAPNTNNLKEQLEAFELKIAEKLFEHHGVELNMPLDFYPFGEAELFNHGSDGLKISDIWKILSDKISRKKGRKFEKLLNKNFDLFFEPLPIIDQEKKDVITGEELTSKIKYLNKEDKEQPVNEYTYAQIELGSNLKNADYWIIAKEKLSYFPDTIYCFEPIGLGLYNYLVNTKILNDYADKLKTSADNVRVIHFNEDNFLQTQQRGNNNIHGFTWYGGNDYPVNDMNEPKTFEELAGIQYVNSSSKQELIKQAPNLSRIGVLRMDVDNLGFIFKSGFTSRKQTFSRYSTLSRSLDWFFKGYLNTIWKNSNEYSQYCQIIYSGGDDLFIVGKWDCLINMAYDIHIAFKRWVCENPELTISGGMATIGPRFPILKGAEYSESFEKAAKKHIYDKQEKNAFAFIAYNDTVDANELILALNWENEFPYLKKLKDEINGLFKVGLSEGFSSSMYNLLQQAKMKINNEGHYYPEDLSVIWLLAYTFKRNSEGKNEQIKSFLSKWSKNIISGQIHGENEINKSHYHPLQFLALAARWAALEDRSKLIKSTKH